MKLYGIPNCGTVKKARVWLDEHSISYEFYDFKKHGVTEHMLAGWLKQVGWQKLLKKTGPTWGQLPDAVKNSIKDDASALLLMLEKPNVIKRPVLERQGKVLATGFSGHGDKAPAEYENLLARSPDGATSHSTRLSKDDNQVAGYLPTPLPQAGEGANE